MIISPQPCVQCWPLVWSPKSLLYQLQQPLQRQHASEVQLRHSQISNIVLHSKKTPQKYAPPRAVNASKLGSSPGSSFCMTAASHCTYSMTNPPLHTKFYLITQLFCIYAKFCTQPSRDVCHLHTGFNKTPSISKRSDHTPHPTLEHTVYTKSISIIHHKPLPQRPSPA